MAIATGFSMNVEELKQRYAAGERDFSISSLSKQY